MYYLLTGCRPYEDARQALLRPYGEPTHLKYFSTGTTPCAYRGQSTQHVVVYLTISRQRRGDYTRIFTEPKAK